LSADVTNLDADATNQEFSSLTGDSARLQNDVQLAQNTPPIPSPSEDALWNDALTDFVRAITEYANGVSDHDMSKISEAAQDTSAGGSSLRALAAQINMSN
jgi:hypothetical protein